jgi:hypothetical protein
MPVDDFIELTVEYILTHPRKNSIINFFCHNDEKHTYRRDMLDAMRVMMTWNERHGREQFNNEDFDRLRTLLAADTESGSTENGSARTYRVYNA